MFVQRPGSSRDGFKGLERSHPPAFPTWLQLWSRLAADQRPVSRCGSGDASCCVKEISIQGQRVVQLKRVKRYILARLAWFGRKICLYLSVKRGEVPLHWRLSTAGVPPGTFDRQRPGRRPGTRGTTTDPFCGTSCSIPRPVPLLSYSLSSQKGHVSPTHSRSTQLCADGVGTPSTHCPNAGGSRSPNIYSPSQTQHFNKAKRTKLGPQNRNH
ncbi:hypothetical protein SKAU_G00338290 [Synaphobranchus kaupii]|uniref:Uncharacterized protein n=1 Tax=Synaphobranchus kaupii TaxID=118154 RepID=A0A9Q1EMJ0_SYNKA|nr:hypothetical protein SKAU_G00338290 [Synaphobranchus kaupii]